MQNSGFLNFEVQRDELVSSSTGAGISGSTDSAPRIGQYRVTFTYDICGPATVIA